MIQLCPARFLRDEIAVFFSKVYTKVVDPFFKGMEKLYLIV